VCRCFIAALLLLVFAIVAITKCNSDIYCLVLNGQRALSSRRQEHISTANGWVTCSLSLSLCRLYALHSGVIIFGSLLGMIGALTLNHMLLALFMFALFVDIIAEIVFIVIKVIEGSSASSIVFEIILLALLVITLAFAGDLRHTIKIEYVGNGPAMGYAQQQPQTTVINNQPQTQTTVVQEV
jgi:hypothetical protein